LPAVAERDSELPPEQNRTDRHKKEFPMTAELHDLSFRRFCLEEN